MISSGLFRLLGVLSTGLCLLDSRHTLVYANPWLAVRLPPRDPLLGCCLFDLLPAEARQSRLARAIAEAIESGMSSRLSASLNGSPLPLTDPISGQALTVSVAVHPFLSDDGQRFCVLELIDITLLAEKEKLLRQQAASLNWQACHDALTELPNRRYLEQRFQELVFRPPTEGLCHGLVVIDLDYFKEVNDRLGHAQGDELLRGIGALLKGAVRGSDVPVRLGGDEFVILLLDCTAEAAERICGQIRQGVEALREGLPGEGFRLAVTLGGVLFKTVGGSLDATMRAADQAMYAVKHSGQAAIRWL
ncbi:MAG: diguanylate cyclase [Gammaproteobacteria bacterium]|nr:diguanylate cyclase [Gammaproteobacteria bacterium]